MTGLTSYLVVAGLVLLATLIFILTRIWEKREINRRVKQAGQNPQVVQTPGIISEQTSSGGVNGLLLERSDINLPSKSADPGIFKGTAFSTVVDGQIEFDRLATLITSNFLDVEPNQFDQMMHNMLEVLGKHFELDRSYLLIFDHEREALNMIEWSSSAAVSRGSILSFRYKDMVWCFDRLKRREIIQVPWIAELPETAEIDRRFCDRREIQSLYIVPMTISGELLATLNLERIDFRLDLSEANLQLLQQIANFIASILERNKNQERFVFQQRRLHLLNEITHSALYAPDEQWMLEIAVDKLVEFIHADACVIMLGDVAGLSYRNLSVRGDDPQTLRSFCHNPEEFVPLQAVLRSGDSLMVDDLDDPSYGVLPFGSSYRSLFSFPLLESDLTLGAAVLFFKDSVRLNSMEIELCEQIADQLSLAVIKIHALADARMRLDETETLREAASVIAATLEPNEAVDRILDELGRVVPYDSACVQILHEGYLEIIGGRGWSDNSAVLGMRFLVPSDNPNTIVVETKEPFILRDAPQVYEHFRNPPHDHIRSWLGVPLIVRGHLIGMFAIDKLEPNYFRDGHVMLVSAFADQVAVLLENARLFENVQRRALELDALRATVTDITAELDLSTLLRAIVERAATLLNLTGGELGLYDDKKKVLDIVVSHNLGMEDQEVQIQLGEGVMGSVAETLEPELVVDYMTCEKQSPQYKGISLHAAAAAPLLIGGRLLGVIGVGTTDPKRRLSSSDITLLNLFAQQAAIAVENARLFETLQTQAVTDPLTNLYNRRGLFEFGQREIEIASRKSRPFSVILFDIDFFKKINDRHSHAVGDEVLCQLAIRCKTILRRSDILGRYGGEEFAVLLPETELQDALLIADRFRLAVSGSPLETRHGLLDVTISCGVTTAFGEIPELAILLDQADTALYCAKQAGRNQTCAFERIKI